MKRNSSFFSASIWYIIANCLGQGIMLLSSIIFTRVMSQEHFGLYTTYYSVVAILTPFVGMNLFMGLNNGYFDFKEDRKGFRASVLFLSFIIFICFSLLVIAGAFFLNKISVSHLSYFVLIFALIHAYAFFVVNYYNNYANMENRFVIKSILIMLPNILQVLLSILLIFFIQKNSYYERVLGSAGGVLLCAVILFISMLFNCGRLINRKYYIYALKISVPSILSSIAYMVMQQSDHIMITRFVGASYTAIYGLVYVVGNILYAFLQATSGAFRAWAYHALDSGYISDTKKIQKWYLFFFTVISVGLLMISPEIIKILAPPNYWDFRYIAPFVAGSCMLVINGFFATVGEFYKKAGRVSLCVAAAALCNVLLNLFFIPRFGALAAAYTSFFSYFILVILGRVLVEKLNRGLFSDKIFVCFFLSIIGSCTLFVFIYENLIMRYTSYLVILLILCGYVYRNKNEIMYFIGKKNENT